MLSSQPPQSAMRAAQSAPRGSQERLRSFPCATLFSFRFHVFPAILFSVPLACLLLCLSLSLRVSNTVSLFARSAPACQPRLVMLFAGRIVTLGGSCSGRLTEKDFGGPRNTLIHSCQAPAKSAKHHQHQTTSTEVRRDSSESSSRHQQRRTRPCCSTARRLQHAVA